MATQIKSLRDLYVDQLKDLYDAENRITKALPKIIKNADSPELKKGLEHHLDQTRNQIKRLDRIFKSLDKKPGGKKCVGMVGLLEEGSEVMQEKMSSPDLMDAALIGACQKVEHYEISGYGTARTFAEILGEQEAVELLSQTLEEEKAADEKLTTIAMKSTNFEAAQAPARM
jgi:ferritin-like metal-binding protein YciE